MTGWSAPKPLVWFGASCAEALTAISARHTQAPSRNEIKWRETSAGCLSRNLKQGMFSLLTARQIEFENAQRWDTRSSCTDTLRQLSCCPGTFLNSSRVLRLKLQAQQILNEIAPFCGGETQVHARVVVVDYGVQIGKAAIVIEAPFEVGRDSSNG